MRFSLAIEEKLRTLSKAQQQSFRKDFRGRKKSVAWAYIAWLLIGLHYLYLGEIPMQLLFYITSGGLLAWYIIDFFRIPGMVRKHNEDLARELMVDYAAMV